MTDPSTPRLFERPRVKHFCPLVHCEAACGPGTCTCRPCSPWCPFCAERRAQTKARARNRVNDLPPVSYQPRLFGAFNPDRRNGT